MIEYERIVGVVAGIVVNRTLERRLLTASELADWVRVWCGWERSDGWSSGGEDRWWKTGMRQQRRGRDRIGLVAQTKPISIDE